MIELIVVLSIVSLLMITTIKWPGKGINLTAQAERLANDIRYVQSLAMANDDYYEITFDTTQNRYTITPGVFPVWQNDTVNIETGITISAISNNYLGFDEKGIPYTNNTGTKLSSDATITLTTEGKNKIITILVETGKVNIS